MATTYAYTRSDTGAQRAALAGYFDRDGIDPESVRWFADDGTSRLNSFEVRPGGSAILDRVVPGDLLVVHQLDRLDRGLNGLANLFATLSRRGLRLAVVGNDENAVVYDEIDYPTVLLFLQAIGEPIR